MRNTNFRKHVTDYKNASMVGVFQTLLEDLETERELSLKACMIESGDELYRAQGQARMLDDLIFVLKGGAAPIQVNGISDKPNLTDA